MSKIQLAVLFGSRSCEREVSIISAIQLMNNVDTAKYDVIPVYIDEQNVWYTGAPLREVKSFVPFDPNARGVERVTLDLTAGSGALTAIRPGQGLFHRTEEKLVARIDCVIIVMHGLNGEDGTLQGLLELANLPYSSTGVAGSAIGMDKIMMKQFFRGADLPVLPGVWFTRARWETAREEVLKETEEALGYPVFVKPACLGSSIGVSRADDRESLIEAFELAFEYDRRVLVEKGLDHPMELNCSVLGYDGDVKASPIEMPVTSEDMLDFYGKYLRGGGKSSGMANLTRIVPAPIPDEMRDELQKMSCEIFRMLDCKGVVRIDYMYDKASDRCYITEINTIPGSLAFYLWEEAGMKYSALIDRMVDCARKAHADRNARNYAFTSDILKAVRLGTKGSKGSKGGKL
ncbi:MAG: D-alanine--D-alanine ligase [Clostridia bacterium]|nr:D-alanine--D-alanine ligase [Clostridia bacterium]